MAKKPEETIQDMSISVAHIIPVKNESTVSIDEAWQPLEALCIAPTHSMLR